MPSTLKTRKISTHPKAASLSLKPRALDAFTVSKATTAPKHIGDKNTHIDCIIPVKFDAATRTRKRKYSEDETDVPSNATKLTSLKNGRPVRRQLASCFLQTSISLAHSQKSCQAIKTLTKRTCGLPDRLGISETQTRPCRSTSEITPSASDSLAISPEQLPPELSELINLHAAFLTALALHCAHNGSHSPADLRNLCPDIARVWGRRSVTLKDIQTALGILNTHIDSENTDIRRSSLSISDYGYGKICIEIGEVEINAGRIARPIDENMMNGIFIHRLAYLWKQRVENVTIKGFIKTLPLQPIIKCTSSLQVSPLVAKGQRRREEMLAGTSTKRRTIVEAVHSPDSTRPSLLERLRAKQMHQLTRPPPPPRAALERKAALDRMEEVYSVLANLSTSSSVGQQRISFTLSTVVTKLKDSFRKPLSNLEAELCIRLLAGEIAPKWVKVAKMGKNEAIVVDRNERPRDVDIVERVRRAEQV